MVLELKDDLVKHFSVGVIFPVNEYSDKIDDLVKLIETEHMKILYVSLNKLYNPLKRRMTQKKIDISKFNFIDCATKTAVPNPEEHDDCTYVSSPDSLTEMSIAITKNIQNYYPDIVIFDSLSTLLIYENQNTATQFVHSLTNKMTAFGVKILFTILDGEKEKPLISDMNMLMDKVVRL